VNQLVVEFETEARLGLAQAMRTTVIPSAPGDEVEDSRTWRLRSSSSLRHEVTRADRMLCALLCDDVLAAAHELETVGPLGAAIACLRVAVHAQRRLATIPAPTAVHHQFAQAGTAYRDTLTPQVAVPTADSWVWEGDLGSAAGIADALVFRQLPGPAQQGPLALIAAALADRAPLGRRAYAAVFAAYGAGLLRVLAEEDGSTALECSREWAALTIAYLDGHHVELRDGRLHLNDRDRPIGPGSVH